MADRRVEFILAMKDQATVVWDKFNSHVAQQSKTLTTTIKENWVGLSASIIGVGYSINKAFELAGVGAKIEQSRAAFKAKINEMGLDAQEVFENINRNAAEMIDEHTIMEVANRAISLGVPIEELSNLMLLARNQARVTGHTIVESFDNITEAVGRGNPRLLASEAIRIKGKDLTKEDKQETEALTGAMGSQADILTMLTKLHEGFIDKIDLESLSVLNAAERHQQLTARMVDMHEKVATVFMRLEAIGVGLIETMGATVNAFLQIVFGAGAAFERVFNVAFEAVGMAQSTFFKDMTSQSDRAMQHLLNNANQSFDMAFGSLTNMAGKGREDVAGVATAFDLAKPSVKAFETEIARLKKTQESYLNFSPEWTKASSQLKDVTEKYETYRHTIGGMQDNVKQLKDEFEKMNPTSAEGKQKFQELDVATRALDVTLERMGMKLKGISETKLNWTDIKFFGKIQFDLDEKNIKQVAKDAEDIIAQGGYGGKPIKLPLTFDVVSKPIEMPLSMIPDPKEMARQQAVWDDQTKIIGEIGSMNFNLSQQEQLDNLDSWEKTAVEMAHDNEKIITDIHRVATVEREAINKWGLEQQAANFQRTADMYQQSLGMVTQFGNQMVDAQLSKLQKKYNDQHKMLDKSEKEEQKALDNEKKKKLKYYDDLLNNEKLTASERTAIQAKRQAVETDMSTKAQQVEEAYTLKREAMDAEQAEKEATLKRRAFIGNKIGQAISAGINTAVAYTKTLAELGPILGPPMAAWVEALGMAQVAMILAQPMPAFHKGSGDKTIGEMLGKSSRDEFPILVKGDETIRTPEQERGVHGEFGNGQKVVNNYNSINLTIENHGNIADEKSFLKLVNEAMRKMNTTDVNRVFQNQHSQITI
jgi:hypothetical protein